MRCEFVTGLKGKDGRCGMAYGNTIHHNATQFGYHAYVEHQEEITTEIDDRILVPREDYETLQHTVQQLQTKYAAILDDKQRWRNFAILSAATQLVAQNKCYSDEGAIKRANEILTAIEEGKFVKTGTSQGPDPGR